ncbi:uncharacterized protein BJ171DRAFT_518512 [Polychytrium aggregatum]|uniref:uncharacterized protein n=1 Tax=Polychytrium aggregatum TaxID=110093 RepID=UPI0022FDEFBF|nr:uncharacterized protein BJ171DRAFT_518512 [Polychytrium aggregatum]KAI9199479.1 hypothetical protein BJ171DRAFT_518512 [Polychytrium aggregatum]
MDKRIRNRLAARRSRQRRLDHIAELEQANQTLTNENDALRNKIVQLKDRVRALDRARAPLSNVN